MKGLELRGGREGGGGMVVLVDKGRHESERRQSIYWDRIDYYTQLLNMVLLGLGWYNPVFSLFYLKKNKYIKMSSMAFLSFRFNFFFSINFVLLNYLIQHELPGQKLVMPNSCGILTNNRQKLLLSIIYFINLGSVYSVTHSTAHIYIVFLKSIKNHQTRYIYNHDNCIII